MHESGNAVVKTPTLTFDTRKSHNEGECTQHIIKV
jgi:hypothetical protein